MSTRSVIGILQDDKTVNSVYCHFDGYPEHTGYFLKKFFDTTEKVQNLISNGDISCLVSNQNWKREKHPMINNKQVLKTLYYVDRPEAWEHLKPQKHKGVWKCYETSDPTKPAPAVTIPETSRFFDSKNEMFVYGFSKVSKVKEFAQ